MNKILVPTDFSEEASNALNAAALIAEKCEAEILLLNVIDSNFDASFNIEGEVDHVADMDQVFVLKMMDIAKDKLHKVVDDTKYKAISLKGDVVVGNPFEKIFKTIDENDIDLVVMGTAGASGLAEIIVGSNTEKVVRMANCPVLTVKSPVNEETFSDIVFATDLGEKQERIVDELKEFQRVFGSKIHIVRVNTPNNFQADRISKEQMRRFVEKHGIKDSTLNIYNDALEEDGIMHYAQDIESGLIAMATHGRRGLSHLFSGSITEDVVNHAKRPVLTFNMKSN